jgi:sarcosine oxidase subunit alpha
MKRLAPIVGEWIDRSLPLDFRFEGRPYSGFAGDTLSSALLAAGESVLARSFKLHRPRSVLGLADTDVNVLVQVGQRLNVRADVEPLAPGLDAWPVNVGAGGLRGDRLAVLDRFSRAFPAGFYYKAFHSKRWFPTWERLIRRMTGLGRLDLATPRLSSAKRYDHCDVLVVGGGAAGLQAALAAAADGAQVLLVDEQARLGGRAFDARHGAIGLPALHKLLQAVASEPRIRTLGSAFAAGFYADHWVPVVTREHIVKVRCRALVVATGTWAQPAVFRHNDRPGVMTADAALRLVHRHAVGVGERLVVLAGNAEGYAAALDLQAQGLQVEAVVDLREQPGPRSAALREAAMAAGLRVIAGRGVLQADAAASGALAGVTLTAAPPRAGFEPGRPGERIACDALLMATGVAPAAGLLYQAGATLRHDESVGHFVPATLPAGVFACGRVAGAFEPEPIAHQAREAGAAAAAFAQGRSAPAAGPRWSPALAEPASHAWPIVAHPDGKEFVDFDEDLQIKDFRIAVQEGFDNIELQKRFTTNGMGPSQGKHSNLNGLRLLAALTGRTPGEVGTTTQRPLVHPVPMALLGGRRFHPHRRTPLDAELDAAGAVWMPAGVWRRPAWFAPGAQAARQHGRDAALRERCIASEVAAVHERCGLIDVGTLGKIEVHGVQAGELLERLYTGRFANMKPGTTRYALALDESGVVIDDGVVCCLAPDRFYVSTTTSAAPLVYREMQRWNALWRLDATLVNVTGQRAALSLAGPRAPAVLAALVAQPLDDLPYLAVRETRWRGGIGLDGVTALLLRVGFVGEWGVEIHVPASAGVALWRAVCAAGRSHGLAPFGVEAQRVLRLEKGHLIVGQDTDGLTTPLEAGLDWALKMDKPFFIGQRSLRIVQPQARRQVLVGFTLPPAAPRPEECHLVIHDGAIAGRVTSVAASAVLGQTVGLAYVTPALAAPGTPITIRLTGPNPQAAPTVTATVARLPFFDPEGQRMRATPEGRESGTPPGGRESVAAPDERGAVALPDARGAAALPAARAWATLRPCRQGVAVERLAGPRIGFKGARAVEFAAQLGRLPDPNARAVLDSGLELLRLGSSEFILDASIPAADAAAGDVPLDPIGAAVVRAGAVPVLHEDAALLLHGPRLRELLLQTCALDLAAPDASDDTVVMTQVIGVAVVATRHRLHGALALRLVFDPTWLDYLGHGLCEIAAELSRTESPAAQGALR